MPFVGVGPVEGWSVAFFGDFAGYTQTFDTQRKNPEFGTLSASWYLK
jgi:hypothetical protein